MPPKVTAERIQIAQDFGLTYVKDAATACRDVGLPFWAACALLEKESGGRNVYGNDKGGVKPPDPVTDVSFFAFLVRVMNGATSNGVGPCQITWAGERVNGRRDGGYFRVMAEQGLRPWVPVENMQFGFVTLAAHHAAMGSWLRAATAYNGGADYGRDFVVKANQWRDRLGVKGGAVS